MASLIVEPLTGANISTVTALKHAYQADDFTAFCEHYSAEAAALFSNIFLESEQGGRQDLSRAYLHLPIAEVSEYFIKVKELRKDEVSWFFTETEYSYDTLDELDKMRYTLLYHYGHQLGGWVGICAMSIAEIIKTWEIFQDITKRSLAATNKEVSHE